MEPLGLTCQSTFSVTQGPLFEEMGEDEMKLFYYVGIEMTTPEGEVYELKTFSEYGYRARDNAERLIEKIRQRGYVNLDHWSKIEPTNEEHDLAPYGPAWQDEQNDRQFS